MALADEAFESLQAISGCEDLAALSTLFEVRLQTIGLTASASGMVTGPRAIGANPFHFVNWPAGWLALYTGQGFVHRDPLPRWALVSGLPITWTALKRTLARNDPGLEIYAIAAEWGFTEGMVVPVRSHNGALGLVSSGGSRAALDAQEEMFVQALSVAVFHKAESLAPSDDGPSRLPMFSRREQEVLNLLHHGFKDREIAAMLTIAIETVRSHLENARIKVGARSRTQLVSLTLSARIEKDS